MRPSTIIKNQNRMHSFAVGTCCTQGNLEPAKNNMAVLMSAPILKPGHISPGQSPGK